MKIICLLVTKAPRLLPVYLLPLMIGGATVVRAQDRGQVGGYFMIVVPRGDFSENVTNNGYGAAASF